MLRSNIVLLSIVIASILLFTPIAYSATQNEIITAINNQIDPDLESKAIQVINSTVKGNWSSIDMFAFGYEINSTKVSDLFVSQFSNTTLIPVIINGKVVNSTTTIPPVINDTIPPPIINDTTTPPVDNGTGDNDTDPIPDPQPDIPVKNVDSSKFLRTCSIGDIDNNAGLVTQLNLMKSYNCKILIVAGDYCYDSCSAVITKMANAGYVKGNTVLIVGNHDTLSSVKTISGLSNGYGTFVLDDSKTMEGVNAHIAFFSIDGNTGLSSSSAQFNFMKSQIEGDEAWYKVAVIHQPFVTVKSDHGPNGQFDAWNPVFVNNGVNLVLEAHNHNYQRFDINGLEYLLTGTGTHDTGSGMYPIGSNSWNGFDCLKCFTAINGFALLDFKINDPEHLAAHGWFISNNDQVKDKFSLMD